MNETPNRRRLSERERLVIGYAHHRAMAPIEELAEHLKVKPHTARYSLDQLKTDGILYDPMPFVNVVNLGFIDYSIYFSLTPCSEQLVSNLLKHLIDSQQIAWLGALGGEYQFVLTIFAKTPEKVFSVLDSLSKQFGNLIHRKCLIIRRSFRVYPRKYLGYLAPDNPTFECLDNGNKVVLDKVDEKILVACAQHKMPSTRQLGQIIDVPHTTISRRLRAMEENGLIQGYLYRVNVRALGISTTKLMIFARGFDDDFSKKLQSFAVKHPQVVRFSQTIGNWDFEMDFELEQLENSARLVQEVQSAFPENIERIQIIQLYRPLKYTTYASWLN